MNVKYLSVLIAVICMAALTGCDLNKSEPPSYTVTYHANGGSGYMSSSYYTFGVAGNLSTNSFTRTGYTFSGWADTPDGVAEYTDSQNIKNMARTEGATVNLYACWDAITYTVVYDANGSSGIMEDSVFTYDAPQNLRINAFTLAGYTFAGWAKTQSGSVEFTDNESVGNLTSIAGAVITLYARWGAHPYSIAYNANGGEGDMEKSVFTYGVYQSLRINAFSRTGYTFAGWAQTADGTVEFSNGASVGNLTEAVDDTVTLYAQWDPVTYTVTYNRNANNAEGTITDSYHTYDVAAVLNANVFSRTGYTFAGWAKTQTGQVEFADKESVLNLAATDNAVVPLYARWTLNQYTVIFDEDGGTEVIQQTVGHGGRVTRPENPAKDGLNFTGWFKEAARSNLWDFTLDTVTGDITLYARWTSRIIDIGEIEQYLNSIGGGESPDNPISLPLEIDLGTMTADGNWEELLRTIARADKFVELDLSACTMNGTSFNPNSSFNIGKSKIVSITLPDTAASIAEGTSSAPTFMHFTNLKSFNGAGLVSIGDYAFYNCTTLNMTTLPAGVTSIGSYAFSGCTGLTELTLPVGITSISDNTFQNCTNLAQITLPAGLTSIGDYAFSGCTSLIGITLPTGLTSIGNYAFSDCTSLSQVTLSILLDSIGGNAFSGCTSLTQITLPEWLTSIGNNAFSDCTSLELVTSQAVTPPSLGGSNVFNNTPGMQIKVSEGRVNAYRQATRWSAHSSVINSTEGWITINNDIGGYLRSQSGGTSANDPVNLSRNLQLTDAVWQNILLAISQSGKYVALDLSACTRSGDNIGSGLRSDGTFDPFPSLTTGKDKIVSIVLPGTATSIIEGTSSNSTFRYFTNLKTFGGAGLTSISAYAFRGCTSLIEITLSEGITSIGNYAFQGCTNLTEITLPAGLTSIGDYAFQGCTNLTGITLSEALASIGNNAFQNCTSLTLVYSNRETPPGLGTSVFNGVHADMEIVVPTGTVAAYRSAANWSSYADRIFAIQSTVTFDKNNSDTEDNSEANPNVIVIAHPVKTVGVLPEEPTRYRDTFTGWNTNIDGTGTAFTAGTVVIDNITVYAQWTPVPVIGVSLNKDKATLTVDGTETLIATVTPSNAKNMNVTWGSSNDSVATVENGVVTAIGAGEATITVTTVDTENGEHKDTCIVTVLQNVSPNRFVYYWVDQHYSLVTTDGGAVAVVVGQTLTIDAQGTGYTVRRWDLNGVNTGQSGNTYTFSSMITGRHTVGLFVEKDGRIYNTNIVVTVQ